MQKLLTKPLLPQNRVTTAVVSSEYKEITTSLKYNYGINIIPSRKNISLESSISEHPDCDIVQLDNKTVFVNIDSYDYFVNYFTNIAGEFLQNFKVIASEKAVVSPYPSDIRLNIKVFGDKIICNSANLDSKIKYFASKNNIRIVHTNQGYSACSIIKINDNALITDDESICYAAQSNGMDCLKISKGSVKLNGHNYGFIGGTCGMIDKNVLAFTGSLRKHSDYKSIVKFLDKHNIKFIELSDNALIDIGGIIPIFEEV